MPTSTRWPGLSSVVPAGSASLCTKTSGPPSRARKPKPFSGLNHFTLPLGTSIPQSCRRRSGRPGREHPQPVAGWASQVRRHTAATAAPPRLLPRLTAVSSPAGPPRSPGHPDYRFSLANERTLLAWLRTALALVAGGVATTQFVPELGFPAGGPVVSIGLLVGGLGTALVGYRRYLRNETAIAADQPLPVSPAG